MSLQEQIDMVKLITGNQQSDSKLVAFYLDAAASFIKAYCGICTISPQLEQVQVQIAAKMLTEQTKTNADGSQSGAVGSGIAAVGSLSDGNQSVSYVQTAGATASFSYDEASIVAAFGNILNRYRVFKTDSGCRSAGVRIPGGCNELGYYTTPDIRRHKRC
jgi:hypothetical protein